jgi:hypothetical protein
MTTILAATGMGAALMMAGCGDIKQEVTEDFSSLAALDEKSDAFSQRMRIVGSLSYGQTSAAVTYSNPPRYRAFKFGGQRGDRVTVWVRSRTGDAVAWVLDNSFRTLAYNDDASTSTLDSKIILALPGNINPDIVTYYIVFRDYSLSRRSFTVSLQGQPANDFRSCTRDSDCVRVEAGCCPLGNWTAVRSGQEDAFHATLHCPAHPMCPMIAIRDDGSVAQCNNDTHKCEVAKPQDLQCGGRSVNPHRCPDGHQCLGPALAYDGFGSCFKTCGGIGARPCPEGFACVDNPYDSCDPAHGGADCPGMCVPQ